jgi:hypothetical protein
MCAEKREGSEEESFEVASGILTGIILPRLKKK